MLGNLLDIANMMQQELRTDMASVDHNSERELSHIWLSGLEDMVLYFATNFI
jgi:hypothetical protein